MSVRAPAWSSNSAICGATSSHEPGEPRCTNETCSFQQESTNNQRRVSHLRVVTLGCNVEGSVPLLPGVVNVHTCGRTTTVPSNSEAFRSLRRFTLSGGLCCIIGRHRLINYIYHLPRDRRYSTMSKRSYWQAWCKGVLPRPRTPPLGRHAVFLFCST
eukprot:8536580-Pyramimonas_sp.AAC.1